jgi:hypothetical protein
VKETAALGSLVSINAYVTLVTAPKLLRLWSVGFKLFFHQKPFTPKMELWYASKVLLLSESYLPLAQWRQ